LQIFKYLLEKKISFMNTIRYSLKHVFARDMALKMNYGSSFDLVKLKKVTVEYTSKYLLEELEAEFWYVLNEQKTHVFAHLLNFDVPYNIFFN